MKGGEKGTNSYLNTTTTIGGRGERTNRYLKTTTTMGGRGEGTNRYLLNTTTTMGGRGEGTNRYLNTTTTMGGRGEGTNIINNNGREGEREILIKTFLFMNPECSFVFCSLFGERINLRVFVKTFRKPFSLISQFNVINVRRLK